jgi:N-acetylglucosamine kinase-like BadF-type ATPase
MDTFLGFDGGGTRTRAWLVDASGRLLGAGEASSSNPNNLGTPAAVAAISNAASAAWAAAGFASRPASAAFAACAGLKTTADSEAFAAALHAAGLAHRCAAANDTVAALAGGLGGSPGLVLIAGTGSFCLGRDASGRTAWRGGWGWLLDDIGGAFWLGREALRAVVLAADGRASATTLREPLLAHYRVAEADALLGALYRPDLAPVELAALAPLVTSAAAAGDSVALSLLHASAQGSAELVRLTAAALAWPPGQPIPLILVGGLALAGPPYTALLNGALLAAVANIELREPLLPPVAGAALRALELGGIPPSPALLAALAQALSHAPSH